MDDGEFRRLWAWLYYVCDLGQQDAIKHIYFAAMNEVTHNKVQEHRAGYSELPKKGHLQTLQELFTGAGDVSLPVCVPLPVGQERWSQHEYTDRFDDSDLDKGVA